MGRKTTRRFRTWIKINPGSNGFCVFLSFQDQMVSKSGEFTPEEGGQISDIKTGYGTIRQ
jgi:hypothetical protein